MDVICLQDIAFYNLIDKVIEHIKSSLAVKEDRWLSGDETMKKLRISSKTTLQKLRDEGKIRFSQPEKKIILYDRESIEDYLQKNTRSKF